MVGISSSIPSTSTLCSGTPSSSRISRSAVWSGVASSGSRAPPGNETCPACRRRCAGRRVKSSRGSSPRSTKGASTAESRSSSPGRFSVPPGVLLQRRGELGEARVHHRGAGSLRALAATAGAVPGPRRAAAARTWSSARSSSAEDQPVDDEHRGGAGAEVAEQSADGQHPGDEGHRRRRPAARSPVNGTWRLQEVPELEEPRGGGGGDGEEEGVAGGVLALRARATARRSAWCPSGWSRGSAPPPARGR